MDSFLHGISILCRVLMGAIFARVILSWFALRPDNPLVAVLYYITEPVLGPLRRIIPPTGMFEFAPMAAIFILIAIMAVVDRLN